MDGAKRIQQAYEAILNNDFELAIERFEQAIQAEPDNADYHYKLSITYARSAKLSKALDHARLAYDLKPEGRQYEYHMRTLEAKSLMKEAEAIAESKSGDPQLAAMLLEQAIKLDPINTDAYVLLGMMQANIREYTKAIQSLEEVIKLEPDHASAAELIRLCKERLHTMLQNRSE